MKYFLAFVRYDKTMDTGAVQNVIEQYLFDALSYTEAEKRVAEELGSFMSGEWEIDNITRPCLSELFQSDNTEDDRWYKTKVAFITLDEKTGAEKRTNQQMLVQAKDFHTALKHLDRELSATLGDWEIVSITETPILDYYPYEPSDSDSDDAAAE